MGAVTSSCCQKVSAAPQTSAKNHLLFFYDIIHFTLCEVEFRIVPPLCAFGCDGN